MPSRRPVPEAVEAMLRLIGLEPRELLAEAAKVAPGFKASLPASARDLISGTIPKTGFGITGSTGVGKTCAMVAILRMHIAAAITKARSEGRETGRTAKETYTWLEWPLCAHWLRQNAVIRPDLVQVAIANWCKAPVLVLDDLGGERRKGDYQEDYACGELDYVISARYRACLPTWYTTNLDQAGLVHFYGARMISRLTGDAPLVELRGVDQRVARR